MTNPEDIQAEIIWRECQLLREDVRISRTALEDLLADDFCEIGRSGQLYDRPLVIDSLMSTPFGDVVIEDMNVRQLSNGVMLLTYRSHRAGPPAADRRVTLCSSIWTLIDGTWKMTFHQGTPAA